MQSTIVDSLCSDTELRGWSAADARKQAARLRDLSAQVVQLYDDLSCS